MKAFKELLKLIAGHKKRILFVGIGNVLRCDDGAGVYIVNHIMESRYITKLLVEVSLENYVSRINKEKPDLLVLVDCIDFGREPGFAGLLVPEETFETTVNTHNLTLRRVTEFFDMPVFILGIQPSCLEVGEDLTPRVKESADNLIRLINKVINQTSLQKNIKPFHSQSKQPNTYAYDNR